MDPLTLEKLQIRRGTTGEWGAENPIFASGELAYNITTNTLYVGDGVTDFNNLMGCRLDFRDCVQYGSVVGIPVGLCTIFVPNPSLSYTPASFNLDGSTNYLNLGSNGVLDFTGDDHSISFWTKFESISGNEMLVCRGSWDDSVGFYIQKNEGFIEVICGRDTVFRTSAAGSIGFWTHWVFVKYSVGATDRWVCYRNGQESTPIIAIDCEVITCSKNLYVGRFDTSGYLLNGGIADIRVWVSKLEQADAEGLYNGSETVQSGNIIGWWRCNETEGEIAVDSSGEGNDGAIVGTLDYFFSSESPFARPILPSAYSTYLPCIGGIIKDPESPIQNTVIPGIIDPTNQLVHAIKIK